MAPVRSYTILGPGAVGLLYGARLQAAGHRVHWVARSGADEMRRHGIRVTSQDGDIEIAADDLAVSSDPADAPASDVVVVALKTTANDHLADLVGPVARDGAAVAMFQNGLGVEERLRAAVPHAGPVLGAMCFVCAHRHGAGVCEHLDYGAVTVGHLDDRPDAAEAAAALVDDLERSGTAATLVPDLGVARWRKLVWNVPFNGLSVVLDASTDALLGDPSTRRLVTELMDEVIEASAAVGSGVDPAFRDQMLDTTDAMTPYAPSMKLDHDAGRAMEIEAIYDAPLAAAAAGGASMPKTAALRDQLRFLDGRDRPSAHG